MNTPLPMVDGTTIVAISTAEGVGALAVLRLSGPAAIAIADGCFVGKHKLLEQPTHTLCVGHIMDKKQVLDKVVVGLFRKPHSYTGEDIIEISCHGSPYIVQRLLILLCQKGATPAAAGEFTKRAFLHGRMDLAQAEAVANLIAAETESAHIVAMQQMKGHVSQQIQAFKKELIAFASLLELELDFSEEDVQFAKRDELSHRLTTMRATIQALLTGFATAQAFKEGVQVVISGPPNAGKSTLFNALLSEEKAMVSPIAGTTRDYIEGQITWQGTRFKLIDTAGLRKSHHPLEQEGVRRSKAQIKHAQLLIVLIDLNCSTEATITQLKKTYTHPKRPLLLVGNKTDLLSTQQQAAFAHKTDILLLSAKNNLGLEQLREKIYAKSIGNDYREKVWISQLRHHELLRQAKEALDRVQKNMDSQPTELLAADIREALRAFGQITGDICTETLLAHIFSHFCIGK